jgi:hypothetical protein
VYVSALCLAVICCCLAVLCAPTSAQVALASASRSQTTAPTRLVALEAAPDEPLTRDGSTDVLPAWAPSAALRALSAGFVAGVAQQRRVYADDLAVLRTNPVDGAELARPSALGRRMGLQGDRPRSRPAPDGTDDPNGTDDPGETGQVAAGSPSAGPAPEHAAAIRMGRGAGGMGGAGSGSAMAPGGQGGSGSAVLCCVSRSADGAGYRFAAFDTRRAAQQAEVGPLVRPG